jgi:type IV secretory pathway VirB4 component
MIRILRSTHRAESDQAGAALAGAPDAVEVAGRSVRIGDGHAATLAVTGYPAEVGAGWLEPLLSYPGRLDVSLHIDPIPAAVAAQRLRTQRGRLESSRRHDAAHGKLDDPELDAAADDAAELAGRMARGEARLFDVGLYLTVHAAEPGELAERVAEVRVLASSLLLDTVPVTWRQLQGWVTTLPLAVDRVGLRRVFDTDALAAAFPFASPDLPLPNDDGGPGMGVLYGLNLASAGVVVWDRWAQDNANALILARSGAGKSYLAKLDLLRNLYLGVDASVIDPEDEYLALAATVGGTVVRLGADGVRINPFDLHPGDGAQALERRVQFVHTFLPVLLGGDPATGAGAAALTPDEAVAVDVAVLAAYRAKGITPDPRSWRRPPPALADLAAELQNLADDGSGRRLAARLRPYVTGSFKALFDGPSTTTGDGHLVVYAIRQLSDELRAVGTLLALDAIWHHVTAGAADGRRRLVLVDEAWLLLSGGLGGRFLQRLAKSARKYNAGLSVVTQDAADVLSTDIGRAVASNAATQILLRQAPQAIDAVTDAFALTDGERAFLLSCGKGDALLASGNARAAFHAQASDAEHQVLLTGPR